MGRQTLRDVVNLFESDDGDEDLLEAADAGNTPTLTTRQAVANYAQALFLDESLDAKTLIKKLVNLVDVMGDVSGGDDESDDTGSTIGQGLRESWGDDDLDREDLLEGRGSDSTKEWLTGLVE